MTGWSGRGTLRDAQPADIAWLVIVVGAIIYELTADDLLSEAANRYTAAHPYLTRLFIAAIAGHLAGVLPAPTDVFHPENFIHRWIIAHYPWARPNRFTDQQAKHQAKLIIYAARQKTRARG